MPIETGKYASYSSINTVETVLSDTALYHCISINAFAELWQHMRVGRSTSWRYLINTIESICVETIPGITTSKSASAPLVKIITSHQITGSR